MHKVISVVVFLISLLFHVSAGADDEGRKHGGYTLSPYDIPASLGDTSLFDLEKGGRFIVGTYLGRCFFNASSDCFNAFGFDQHDKSFTSYNVGKNFTNFVTALSDLAVVGSTDQPDGRRVGTIWPRKSSHGTWKKIMEPLLPSFPKRGPIIIDINPFLGTSLLGVNNRGHLVGAVQKPDLTFRGFVIAEGQISIFNYPNAQSTLAEGIRKDGTIVGNYILNGRSHGFLRHPSGKKFVSFDVPNSCETAIYDTNDAGDLAGAYFDCVSQQVRGYVFTSKRQLIPIIHPGVGTFATEVRGLDEKGNIAGRFDTDIGGVKKRHGFIGLLKGLSAKDDEDDDEEEDD